jgi:hypothetical protein
MKKSLITFVFSNLKIFDENFAESVQLRLSKLNFFIALHKFEFLASMNYLAQYFSVYMEQLSTF